jgi:hypothetical protein
MHRDWTNSSLGHTSLFANLRANSDMGLAAIYPKMNNSIPSMEKSYVALSRGYHHPEPRDEALT